jgi:glutaredoxin
MRASLISLLLIALPASAVQLYQWKDAQGRITYSDQPPPPNSRNVQQKVFRPSVIESNESYPLKLAREKFPVTLYATACGAACDQARQLLNQRGIPYAEKNPETSEADRAVLQKLSGQNRVPVLLVGNNKIDGFESGQWQDALDRAGYPKSAAKPTQPAASTTPAPTAAPAPAIAPAPAPAYR